jgi:hypothetical protein
MRLPILAATILSVTTAAAAAESLDVGGIELHLGQKVDDALKLLSSYQVQRSSGSWVISQKTGEKYEFLGAISATNNALSFISKSFQMDAPESALEIYSLASRELHRRGGGQCSTYESKFSDGIVRGFETRCGVYVLTYYMPSRTDNGIRSLGGISISIRTN